MSPLSHYESQPFLLIYYISCQFIPGYSRINFQSHLSQGVLHNIHPQLGTHIFHSDFHFSHAYVHVYVEHPVISHTELVFSYNTLIPQTDALLYHSIDPALLLALLKALSLKATYNFQSFSRYFSFNYCLHSKILVHTSSPIPKFPLFCTYIPFSFFFQTHLKSFHIPYLVH